MHSLEVVAILMSLRNRGNGGWNAAKRLVRSNDMKCMQSCESRLLGYMYT
jgi:hypothetical protein